MASSAPTAASCIWLAPVVRPHWGCSRSPIQPSTRPMAVPTPRWIRMGWMRQRLRPPPRNGAAGCCRRERVPRWFRPRSIRQRRPGLQGHGLPALGGISQLEQWSRSSGAPYREDAEAVRLDRVPAIRQTGRTEARRGEIKPMQLRIQRLGAGADLGRDGGADVVVVRIVLMYGGDGPTFAVGAVDHRGFV